MQRAAFEAAREAARLEGLMGNPALAPGMAGTEHPGSGPGSDVALPGPLTHAVLLAHPVTGNGPGGRALCGHSLVAASGDLWRRVRYHDTSRVVFGDWPQYASCVACWRVFVAELVGQRFYCHNQPRPPVVALSPRSNLSQALEGEDEWIVTTVGLLAP